METTILENLYKENFKDMEFTSGKTAASMRVHSKKERDKERANGNHTMVISLKENTSMILRMAGVNSYGQMAKSMKANSEMT